MIPWSAEGERSLRMRITVLQTAMLLSLSSALGGIIGGLWFVNHRLLIAGVLCLVPLALAAAKGLAAVDELGWEETISRGVRIPGSGMLANKPRDTSRLTKWVQLPVALSGPGISLQMPEMGRKGRNGEFWTFTCNSCKKQLKFSEMKWIPNVQEEEPEFVDTPPVEQAGNDPQAVDPGGGRWVLICECGMGHYMLEERANVYRQGELGANGPKNA